MSEQFEGVRFDEVDELESYANALKLFKDKTTKIMFKENNDAQFSLPLCLCVEFSPNVQSGAISQVVLESLCHMVVDFLNTHGREFLDCAAKTYRSYIFQEGAMLQEINERVNEIVEGID